MEFDWNEIEEYIHNCSEDSKIYVGCDSEKYKKEGKFHARYTVAIVVHVDGNSGCKVFGEVSHEVDYDHNHGKPMMRLMNEVYKGVEAYQRLLEIAEGRDMEIHLDISTKESEGSNCALSQAMGYVKGMCNITPKVKPHAFAASYAADQYFSKIENGKK